MPRLRGLRGFMMSFVVRFVVRSVVRCSFTVLPLTLVILLCCLMMGFRGKPTTTWKASAPSAASLPIQSALVPAAEAAIPPATPGIENRSKGLAAFERLHITHAHLNVPTD